MTIQRYALIGSLVVAACIAGFVVVGQAEAASAPDGATLYRQRCQMCHLSPPKQGALGPSLVGVVGRKAGTTNFNYSPAMKKSGLIWTNANLDRFLTNPRQLVPGTKMVIAVSDSKERVAIIKYITK